MVKLKRVYEPADRSDGFRILVDRLWPRGLGKAKARVNFWLKDIAPTNALRQWFGHDPQKWPEFQKRYRAELRRNKAAVAELKSLLRKHRTATLVYGAKDTEHNQAVALKAFISK